MELPKLPEQLSIQFLREALKDQEWSKHVASFTYETNKLQGNTSYVALIQLTYNGEQQQCGAPQELIIKFALPDKNIIITREELVKVAAYRKEVSFYQYLLNNKSNLLQQNIFPPIYYAQIDENCMDQFLIIMGKSGSPMDPRLSCTPEQARDVLRKWALVQAKFWYREEDETKIWNQLHADGLTSMTPAYLVVGRVVDPSKDYTGNCSAILGDALPLFQQKWENYAFVLNHFATLQNRHQLKADIELFNEHIMNGKAVKLLKEGFERSLESSEKTLCHCDFRLDNFLIKDERTIELIDFQAISFGNCSYDLAQFFAQSLSKQQTDDHFEELMTLYWDTVTKVNPQIAKNYSLQQLKRATQTGVVVQLMMLSFYVSAWKKPIQTGVDIPALYGRNFDFLITASERTLHCYNSFFKQEKS